MKSLVAVSLLITSAAAPAAAQLRVGVNVGGTVGRAVPAVGMEARREYSPTTLPLTSLMLPPSLSAPSVSPDRSAVVLPVLNPPSVAVQNPSPSKAAELRIEAARSIADWKASRSAPSSGISPEPSSPASELDALFDGSLPTSAEILSRASSLGLPRRAIAFAISESRSPSEAVSRLSALKLLGTKEAALATPETDDFYFLLTRLWRKTAPSVPAPFTVDASFGVPALKIERGRVSYFVHAVVHGQLGPPRRGAVLSTVRRVVSAGHSLYSEQNLPAYYGYNAGHETLDHVATMDAPTPIVPAAPGYTRAALILKRAADWAAAPGSLLAALAWALISPASWIAWALLPALGVFTWLTLAGNLPWLRWKHRRFASDARAAGLEDEAGQYADEADHFFVSKPDLEILRGLELPQPLGAQLSDDVAARVSVRSRAIADAVAADAVASGATAVHLVVGHMHAHEVAWRLSKGAVNPGPGSQSG